MVDTVETISQLLTEAADGQASRAYNLQRQRNVLVTMAAMAGYGSTLTTATAAGSTQATATQLSTFSTSVNSVSSGSGVQLMSFANAPLVIQKVINDGTNILAVYPPSGVALGAPGARLANQAILVAVGGTVEIAMTSSTTGEIVANFGDSQYVPARMGVTGGYRNTAPPWVNRLKNNTDVVDRSAVLPSGSSSPLSSPPLGVTKPTYLGTVIDPYYGTRITRISGDPGTTMLNIASGTWGRAVRHHYSTDQAWNCDESLLMISTNADVGGNSVATTLVTNGTTASGNAILHFASTASSGVYVGSGVTGTNIPASTTILSFDATSITMSANATSTGVASAATITFVDVATPQTNIFLDGQSYVPLFTAAPPNGDPRWHPTLANTMIYADFANPSSLFTYVPVTNTSTLVSAFANAYKFLQIGGGHGCVTQPVGSEATPLVPLMANRVSDSAVVAFVYDFSTNTKSVEIPLAAGGTGQWQGVDVSATGTYVVCVDSNDIVFVFNRVTGVQVGSAYGTGTSGQPSHYDISVDQAGNECIVGVDKIAGANVGRVCKRILSNGTLSYLTPLSPANFASHISTQSFMFPGWGTASYYSRFEAASSPLYIGEIIAYPLDGSQNPVRLCHHWDTNNPANYYNESHPSFSPTGTRVIFHSNWGNPNNDGRPQQLYICDMRATVQLLAG